MLHNKSFMKKTKSGKVMKIVREHYLREDLTCGFVSCPHCSQILDGNPTLSALQTLDDKAETILIIDTNVVLHQIDALEHPKITNVVIPKVVEEEVKHNQTKTHQRLREIIAEKEKRFFLFDNEHHKWVF